MPHTLWKKCLNVNSSFERALSFHLINIKLKYSKIRGGAKKKTTKKVREHVEN